MYQFNEIPQDLKRLPQWVVWKKEVRKGKITKVPYQINGEMAQANNRRTWSTFQTATKAYLDKKYDGIGFMFSQQDTYIGIDIDHCVTDETPNAFASEIIDLMDSYTEFSPSGEGIHIIVKGNMPDHIAGTGKRSTKHGLEIYQHGRYFTFTGNRENENDVLERTDELEELFEKYFDDIPNIHSVESGDSIEATISNDELWQRMFRSAKGDAIKSMYDGHLVKNDHSGTDQALANHLAFWTGNNAYQIDSMFRETALMRDKWDKVHYSNGDTHGERTIATAIAGTSSTIFDRPEEPEFEIKITQSEDDVFNEAQRNFMLTELGNAERIIAEYGNVVRHIDEVGWYIWDGRRWKADKKLEIERITAKVLRKLLKSEDEAVRKWGKNCEKRAIRMNSIKDMVSLASAEREDFDTHGFLFNVSNGVINLKEGKLYPHDREYMITKMANIEYDEKAECPNWQTFLESIFKNDQGETDHQVIEFMQRAIGYSLTGDISEQVMFFLFGGGRNGKSTFINTVQNLIGDYGRQTNSETFIKKSGDGSINNDIARLAGSRFVSAIESEDGQHLSESLVKQITGGERISARFLRQEFFEFTPEFKVFFTTNHKPIVKGIDEGIWRRIKLIPFTVTIPKEKVDKKLPEKLSAEMSGILNWAIEGCLKWQKDGLGEPKTITDATSKYKTEMDILDPFIEEKCFLNPLAKIEAKELFQEYSRWCMDEGEFTLKNRTFYRLLEGKELYRERGTANKIFVKGIGLQREKYKYIPKSLENDSEIVTKGKIENSSVTPFMKL